MKKLTGALLVMFVLVATRSWAGDPEHPDDDPIFNLDNYLPAKPAKKKAVPPAKKSNKKTEPAQDTGKAPVASSPLELPLLPPPPISPVVKPSPGVLSLDDLGKSPTPEKPSVPVVPVQPLATKVSPVVVAPPKSPPSVVATPSLIVAPASPPVAVVRSDIKHRRLNLSLGLSMAAPLDGGDVQLGAEFLIPAGDYDVGVWGRIGASFVRDVSGVEFTHAEGIFLRGVKWYGGPTFKWVGSQKFVDYWAVGATVGRNFHVTNNISLYVDVFGGFRRTEFFDGKLAKVAIEPSAGFEWSPTF